LPVDPPKPAEGLTIRKAKKVNAKRYLLIFLFIFPPLILG
jgi:hypothetical protein